MLHVTCDAALNDCVVHPELGFAGVTQNSLDGTSDRDFVGK